MAPSNVLKSLVYSTGVVLVVTYTASCSQPHFAHCTASSTGFAERCQDAKIAHGYRRTVTYSINLTVNNFRARA